MTKSKNDFQQKLIEWQLNQGNVEGAYKIYLDDKYKTEEPTTLTNMLQKLVPYVLVIFTLILMICVFKVINYFFNYNYELYDKEFSVVFVRP